MKTKYALLVLFLVFSANTIFSQKQQKLLFAGENYAWQNQFATDNKLQRVYLLYQSDFVDADGITFNRKRMLNSIDKFIPNKLDTGYAVLDWEGAIYDVLVRGGTIPILTHQDYMNRFIAAIQYAKLLRPYVRWSYYAIPHKLYVQYSSYSMENNMKWILPLLKECDFMAPSLYFLYDGSTLNKQFVTQYMDSNVKYALEIGSKLKKPVFIFVWHRYHPLSTTNGNKLIDFSTFKATLSRFKDAEYFNNKVDGVIWWNSEDTNAASRTVNPIMMEEYKNVTDVAGYKLKVLQSYLDSIRPIFTN